MKYLQTDKLHVSTCCIPVETHSAKCLNVKHSLKFQCIINQFQVLYAEWKIHFRATQCAIYSTKYQ